MNSILLKESDLEINEYLNSLSLHQSFEEDDTDDDEFLTVNPSGSVLQPTSNPYNKQKKIAEANETLFAEEVVAKAPQRVKFNRVEKRICYDYFGSSFESDSIKSYEDEESEKESVLQSSAKPKTEPTLNLKGTNLQPKNPASKVVVTVSPKKEEEEAHSESESEDVCVGTVTNSKGSNGGVGRNKDISECNGVIDQTIDSSHQATDDKINPNDEETSITETKAHDVKSNHNGTITEELENINNTKPKSNMSSIGDCKEELVQLELEKHSQHYSNSMNDSTEFYPCLANHSGITIRITGADSIESIDSDSTDDEVQIEDDYSSSLYNIVEFKPENKILISKTYQNSRVKETTFKVSKDAFILKGTKSTQNIRSPKTNKRMETGPFPRSSPKKEPNVSKQDSATEKTELVPSKVQNESSKVSAKSKTTSFASKHFEEDTSKKTDECFPSRKKVRPKSCVEKESAKVKTNLRPLTAPVKRSCCQWGQPHLPEYNGLRSEYGLTAEQLMERKRKKLESLKIQKQKREQKFKEEQEKRKENEATFIAWLENKKKQAQMQYLRNQRIKAESGIKIYPAPTAHLKRTGAVRSRKLFKSQRKCVSLEELLNNASSHEKKTYKIYLGLSFE